MRLTRGQPLPLTEEAKRRLDESLKRDVSWLRSMAVVD
jgi:1-phosphatidylinositol-3-phosphate 5-kinase